MNSFPEGGRMIAEGEIKKGMIVLNIIWAAIVGSLGIYIIVAQLVQADVRISMEAPILDTLRMILYGISFVIIFAIRFMKKMILKADTSAGVTSPRTGGLSGNPMVAKYTTAMVVSWAMGESIGVFGLVLFLIGKNTMDLYLLVALSFVTLMNHRPRRDEIVELGRNSTTEENS
jgi:hypothetical protein